MQGTPRKIVQALAYEGIAVLCVAPALQLVYAEGAGHSLLLSLIISAVALAWNVLFNAGFERWEARQRQRQRTWQRRLLHAIGFEGGLTLILLPIIAGWLGISLLSALLTNLALFAFFFVYALVFQWGFDRVFGLPQSAAPSRL
ncbi:PACE efflux transporter [Pseudomonas sp. HR96]|uniref:PACE efflux transporter n=1 Tax=Pseudomonas sp. HR96 TaxID=1027966 RepID=UPI002A757713|nr:PACE efflux transporter [Pseudomonas sp. HR96]WPP01817.1 PACE efflux transporter [Pseudomonas sp. HR96]